MSIFPTKVLLATDGSKEAELAAETASELAQQTGSELHVVHVLFWASESALDPEGFDPAVREEIRGRALREHFKTLCYGVRAASRKEEISGWYGPFCARRSSAPTLRL